MIAARLLERTHRADINLALLITALQEEQQITTVVRTLRVEFHHTHIQTIQMELHRMDIQKHVLRHISKAACVEQNIRHARYIIAQQVHRTRHVTYIHAQQV